MGFTCSEEQKKYRNSFVLMTLISIFGILIGLYLYEYTDYFSALRADALITYGDKFDIKQLLLIYSHKARLLCIIVICGFTLLAPYLGAIITAYEGFICGFGVICYGICYQNGALDKLSFFINCTVLIITLLVYIAGSAKSLAFSLSLRYAAPDIVYIMKQRQTKKYLISFMILAAILFAVVALKYAFPLIFTK